MKKGKLVAAQAFVLIESTVIKLSLNNVVKQFYNELINGGLKPNSTKKIIEVLTGCYKYAKKLNLMY